MKNTIYQVISDLETFDPTDTLKESQEIVSKLEECYGHITIVKLTEKPSGSGLIEEDIIWSNNQL